MQSEPKWVYERMDLYELIQVHPDWNSRHYAHVLGDDRKWVRKWKVRIQSASEVSVKTFQSQSRAPKHPPRQIPEEAKEIGGARYFHL